MTLYDQIIQLNRAFIIAEAGVNHNGNLDLAKQMVDIVKESGCDAIKFQTFRTEAVISKKAEKAQYQKQQTNSDESQFDMVKTLELSEQDHFDLFEYCEKKNVLCISAPFDEGSVDLLDRLRVPMYKIPSGEITNIPFLLYVAKKMKPILLSTGMSTLEEVREAVDTINSVGNNELILLQCTTAYPTPVDEVNLKAMKTLEETFKVPVGFSDHTIGHHVSVAAIALGAKVIEKHFTLSRDMKGPDHKASLEPDELKEMVGHIKDIEKALGDGVKKPAQCEKENIMIARKSIVASEDIQAGEIITKEMLVIKRPGEGVLPKDIDNIIGLKTKQSLKEDDVITWGHLT